MNRRARDTRRRSHSFRPGFFTATVAIFAVLLVSVTLVIRALPLTNLLTLILAAGSPYVPLVALTGLVLAVSCRRKLVALLATGLMVSTLAIQGHWYFLGRSDDAGVHTEIRVLSSNLRLGQADPATVVGLATRGADVITVSELTDEAVARFRDAGIRKTFPYSILTPRPGAGGMGLFSRYPVTALPRSKYGNNLIAARVRVPGLTNDPLVVSVHLMSPVAGDTNTFEDWNHRINAAKSEFADYAKIAGPAAVIIAGDFNATPDMRQFRDLLDVGYRDAVNQTGSGFSPTYSPRSWLPPLITIDHVLTRNAAATSIHSVDMPGSDHRALLATVAVPVAP